MIAEDILQKALQDPFDKTQCVGLGLKVEGKVRDSYHPQRGLRLLIATDRVSAFDRVLGSIPFKGQILTCLSYWWFQQLASLVHHHVRRMPDPNTLECIECTPLPVEMVVRRFLTGTTSTSMWVHYQAGERVFCGYVLPEGLRRNQRLNKPLLTPSTKAPAGQHDQSCSREEILRQSGLPADAFDEAAALAMLLFEAAEKRCAESGLLLVDTKYEFGRTPDGKVVVIDEIHTPDSSRLWKADSYEERLNAGEEPESLDKDFIRHYFQTQGFHGEGPIPPFPDAIRVEAARRYVQIFEQLTGVPFEPNTENPHTRLQNNLAPYQQR
ncbi:phosphoribosylaminoimidazolesuccinocarboxamide synthase [Pajaroellobacter abortibovis]|uniref:Phosphoribosylaminoimidazole-succinocarboxamide synthase n=1 Tax=Pajaroellobacter abortibovis TaxID=1882918 RepID=A0A1L6MV38_9BACT|nr:phosphoribosylaminoimidazolesuccinocarboxamide synthase [Pajaroellobacter abortibovis]APR99356.1 phosphoribosylaminoimidazolesuccinocarboxamide synthase [Pajaroellobacter abortibovis]